MKDFLEIDILKMDTAISGDPFITATRIMAKMTFDLRGARALESPSVHHWLCSS